MISIPGNRTYRNLFGAQIIALVGTGLATVALGLLAYDIAGGNAGAVLGTALAIKMIAYIGVAPVVGAFADRLAYDLENLLSPILAAVLLTVISFHWLFAGTSVGFIFSALFVLSVTLPVSPAKPQVGSIYARTTRGIRAYLKTPRLKGLLAITFAAAAASSMVIVNTVVIVREMLGLGQREVALTLAAYGGGSMLAAFILPRLLDRMSDRKVMLFAATVLSAGLGIMAAAFASDFASWPVLRRDGLCSLSLIR